VKNKEHEKHPESVLLVLLPDVFAFSLFIFQKQ